MNEEDLADIRDWAERFWLLAGKPEPFPRSLETSVLRALPLVIVKLPRLDVERINDYLQDRGLNLQCLAASRRLRGCLLARSGSGIVFLDGTDPADELRFTLAHEVAHFLLDHLQPRQRAVKALGPAIQDVLGRASRTHARRTAECNFSRRVFRAVRAFDGPPRRWNDFPNENASGGRPGRPLGPGTLGTG